MTRAFFDSNVLLYVARHDPDKADTAERLSGAGGVISIQVLNEVVHVARRKFGYDWAQTRRLTEGFEKLLTVTQVTVNVHHLGLHLAERHRLSWWDALIVAAALETGCDVLYSEDMHHGLVVDGRLTITNPFLA